MRSTDFPLNCYFCRELVPKIKIEKIDNYAKDEVPLLRIGWCPYCLINDDIKTATIMSGNENEPVAAHIYYDDGNDHYRLVFLLDAQTFGVYCKKETNIDEGPPIYWTNFVPDINPKNVRQRLLTILTFL